MDIGSLVMLGCGRPFVRTDRPSRHDDQVKKKKGACCSHMAHTRPFSGQRMGARATTRSPWGAEPRDARASIQSV